MTEPVAWALDKGDGPRVPYPASAAPGSHQAVENHIMANPTMGWRAVPLYAHEGTDLTERVEAAARAFWNLHHSDSALTWDDAGPTLQHSVREALLPVIIAALEA